MMTTRFPWRATDDELLLNAALEEVLRHPHPGGRHEDVLIYEAATALIAEAYDQGVRDEAILVQYAWRRLRQGRRDT
jgi:hypothetical protein